MSDRDKAIEIVKELPEDKITYVLTYLKGMVDGLENEPNDETMEAIREVEEMKKDPSKVKTYNSFSELLEDI